MESRMKTAACEQIDSFSTKFAEISKAIWDNPELNYEEYKAHDRLVTFFEEHGFRVTKHYHLKTAFKAEFGEEGEDVHPNIGILCEYDALPEIGHACGHNLIAELGVAAAVGLQRALTVAKEKDGKLHGKITVLGTPAEEGSGGKLDLIEAGVFKPLDVAMMAHPFDADSIAFDCLARDRVHVRYLGKASHASAFPWEGVNALDAAVLCYQNISVMRQQLKPTWRVHGVITNGGAKPNIIPEVTDLEYCIRAPSLKELLVLREKAVACFEAAAKATGCQVEMKFDVRRYLNIMTNTTLARLTRENAKPLGIPLMEADVNMAVSASTDMGNVTHVVPGIHPCFYIGTDAKNHTRDYTAATGDPTAQPYTINMAKCLAMVGIDLLLNPDVITQVQQDFRLQRAAEGYID